MLKGKALPVFLLIICMLLTSCGKDTANDSLLSETLITPKQANYDTVAAEKGIYKNESNSAASVVHLISAELTLDSGNAYLQQINVKKNQSVKKGDVLAVFAIDENVAQKTELQLNLQRKEEAYEQGVQERLAVIREIKALMGTLDPQQQEIALLNLEKQEVAFDQFVYQSEWEIASIQARLNELIKIEKNNTLVAPFDGIVKSVANDLVGNNVNSNDVIVSMYSEDGFCLRVKNSENKLRYGMEVSIATTPKNGEKKYYTGVVVSAPNILSSSVNQTDAYIVVNETVDPNDFGNSIVCYGNMEYLEDVLLVDRAALIFEDSRVYVKILEDNIVKKRYVVRGLAKTDMHWILDGLEEGQLLIAE